MTKEQLEKLRKLLEDEKTPSLFKKMIEKILKKYENK